MTFARWLTAQMDLFGFTSDTALARELRVNDSTVGRWRKGSSAPDIPQLRRIAALLHAPLPRLLVLAGHLTAEELAAADMGSVAADRDEWVARALTAERRLQTIQRALEGLAA